jgi:hypothetical protein
MDFDTTKIGYLYCFSNPSMPGILKIGMTMRSPPARLKEANSSYTWKPPTPYVIEVAKRVFHPKRKEKALHELLETYAERVSSKQEFFRVSLETVNSFLDLMDGDRWEPAMDSPTMDRIVQLHEKGHLLYQLLQKCPYEDSFVDLLEHSCSEIESMSAFVKECIVADPSGSIKDVDMYTRCRAWTNLTYGTTKSVNVKAMVVYIQNSFPSITYEDGLWKGIHFK